VRELTFLHLNLSENSPKLGAIDDEVVWPLEGGGQASLLFDSISGR
jgi:hypothetical protein